PQEISKMARAGAVLVDTLALLQERIRPGVSTAQLDQLAERFIRSRGAVPTFKGYRGFPGSICASPNAMIVHGIPGPYRLAEGDIVSIDVGVTLDGWVADAARTFPVRVGGDGWAIFSQDGSPAAHFEFTVAVTTAGPSILTPWHLAPRAATGSRASQPAAQPARASRGEPAAEGAGSPR